MVLSNEGGHFVSLWKSLGSKEVFSAARGGDTVFQRGNGTSFEAAVVMIFRAVAIMILSPHEIFCLQIMFYALTERKFLVTQVTAVVHSMEMILSILFSSPVLVCSQTCRILNGSYAQSKNLLY